MRHDNIIEGARKIFVQKIQDEVYSHNQVLGQFLRSSETEK